MDAPIFYASTNGHLDVARFLLDRGANVNSQDDLALISASKNGILDVVRLLLDRGANVNGQDDLALSWASDKGHIDSTDPSETRCQCQCPKRLSVEECDK